MILAQKKDWHLLSVENLKSSLSIVIICLIVYNTYMDERVITTQEAVEATTHSRTTSPLGVEFFLAGNKQPSSHLADILTDPKLLEQAAQRRKLHDLLKQVFSEIPDPHKDIAQAVIEGVTEISTVEKLYDSLSDFIEQDPNNTRLILYLPFALLPDMTGKDSTNIPTLSARRLAGAYRDAWIRQLHTIEPRANFTNGDIFEPGLGEPERIAKAGHLVPEIITRGIINTRDLSLLISNIEDPEILKPLAEGATVAYHAGLIPDSEWESLSATIDTKLKFVTLGPDMHDESQFTHVSEARKIWLANVAKEAQIPPLYDSIDFSDPLPVKPETLAKDFAFAHDAMKKIHDDPILSQALYPSMLVFGSRIKGYARVNSDYDGAIFFKPGVTIEDREAILTRLYEIAPEIKKIAQLLEYWMQEDEEGLRFKEIPNNLKSVGAKQVYLFLNGAWISHGNEHTQIQRDTLNQYVHLPQGDNNNPVRKALLTRLEQDILQYRLLHSGYRKVNPSHKKSAPTNGHLIDWNSDFWDPGYRRVASQLFLSRVFLPQLD